MSVDPRRVETLFADALGKPAAERTSFLLGACGDDATLRQRVQALLAAHAASDGFLEPTANLTGAGGIPTSNATVLEYLGPTQRQGALGRLGHYDVLEVIGTGGFGTVLRAFDTKLHRMVAIKVLSPELSASAEARTRFTREARAAAAVSHEHLVTIHAVEEEHRPPYLVMQLVDGMTLQQKLDKAGVLGLKEILRIGLQIAQGLEAAHKHGLVHRDVKPANILLENGIERVKITDFGLARPVTDGGVTRSGVLAGTPAYMSPEQADDQAIDHRSDLFSLGTVLYLMCTGRQPFQAAGWMAVLRRVTDDTPTAIGQINPEVPDWLEAIVAKLHAKNPAERFESAQHVAKLLEKHLAALQTGGRIDAAAAGTDTAAVPAAPVPRSLHRPVRPARWLAAGIIVLLLGGAAYFVWQNFGLPNGGGDNVVPDGNAPPLAVAPFDAAEAKAHQLAWAKHLGVPVEIEDSVGMKLRLIPPGKYLMGTDADAMARISVTVGRELTRRLFELETPQREVTIAKAFYMGAHEVTVAEFRAFVDDTKHRTQAERGGGGFDWDDQSKKFQRADLNWRQPGPPSGDRFPVTQVSLTDTNAFLQWLSRKEGQTYRLPTEQQWEYACRAGSEALFAFGDDWDLARKRVGHLAGAKRAPVPVGSTYTNPFGLSEMHGNVCEWCIDARLPGKFVLRGGDFIMYIVWHRSAARWPVDDVRWESNTGFRVVRQLE
jgi:formylglycine-generating enzyme required for sulfatase activity